MQCLVFIIVLWSLAARQVITMNSDNNTLIKRFARTGPASTGNPLLFERIFILVMENRSYKQTLNTPAWRSIIQTSAWFTGMYATTHPSQPNYVAMIAGSTLNCKDNGYFSTNETTIINLLNKAGVSWKSYQENYTALITTTRPRCNDAMELAQGLYVRRHNPFMFSAAVRNNVTECEKIVNADQLAIDIVKRQLTQFAFYTPNMKNNAHDTDLTYAGNYLRQWLHVHLNNAYFMNGTLLIVTFDEDEVHAGQTNHIPMLMWGKNYLHSGITISGTFNHYSLTRLLEENWNLGNLGRNDVTAPSLMDLWRLSAGFSNESLGWTNTPSCSNIVEKGLLSACFLLIIVAT